jgi:hypothetical protein
MADRSTMPWRWRKAAVERPSAEMPADRAANSEDSAQANDFASAHLQLFGCLKR